ncbi:MAG: DNA repair protein RecN [Gemmatimonadota bacterium]
MLLELRIRNLAVVRDLSVELRPGLNVLTGETGAGKSIIVGALGLLLGERASIEAIREGSDRATVEGVFDVAGNQEVPTWLRERGFEVEDGHLVLLKREVRSEGRSRGWINGSAATAGTLGELGRHLVDFHGQHEHQTLLLAEEQREILDAFGGVLDLAATVAGRHTVVSERRRQATERRDRTAALAARGDFLRFQLREIDEVDPEEAEDERIAEELGRLQHAEELMRGAAGVHQLLYTEEGAASDRLAEAREVLGKLASFDSKVAPLRDLSDELYHRVSDLGRAVEKYANRVDVSPERTEELRARVDQIFRLKRKYGPDLSDVLQNRARLASEIEELESSEIDESELKVRLQRAESELRESAAALSAARRDAGDRLATEVEAVLPDLGMPGARFAVELDPVDPPESGGAEHVRFIASLNPGFELRSLSRIASGGELSRVMLALKSILAAQDRIPTLVFDEIDAGVGGAVAVAVGAKLREVAERHQVFAITHLPQIAARGAHHLRVEKRDDLGETLTSAVPLTGSDRVREIARMLGGDPESATSRDHAAELLEGCSTAV